MFVDFLNQLLRGSLFICIVSGTDAKSQLRHLTCGQVGNICHDPGNIVGAIGDRIGRGDHLSLELAVRNGVGVSINAISTPLSLQQRYSHRITIKKRGLSVQIRLIDQAPSRIVEPQIGVCLPPDVNIHHVEQLAAGKRRAAGVLNVQLHDHAVVRGRSQRPLRDLIREHLAGVNHGGILAIVCIIFVFESI